MIYQLRIKKNAIKSLSKIDEPYYSKIKAAILNLQENPRPIGCKKLQGRNGYRVRVANYRIIYEILDAQLIIDVVHLGHRKDIYR